MRCVSGLSPNHESPNEASTWTLSGGGWGGQFERIQVSCDKSSTKPYQPEYHKKYYLNKSLLSLPPQEPNNCKEVRVIMMVALSRGCIQIVLLSLYFVPMKPLLPPPKKAQFPKILTIMLINAWHLPPLPDAPFHHCHVEAGALGAAFDTMLLNPTTFANNKFSF